MTPDETKLLFLISALITAWVPGKPEEAL